MHVEQGSAGPSLAAVAATDLGRTNGLVTRPVVRRNESRADCRTRYGRVVDLRADLAAAGFDWLTDGERQELGRCVWRREAWLGGRLLGKRLVVEALGRAGLPLHAVEIRSRDAAGRPVRPALCVEGQPLSWRMSISHTDRAALVALTARPGRSVGVDLSPVSGSPNPAALVFWFSRKEQRELALAEPRQAALCWAIKEAAYKACNTGESFVPRRFEVFRPTGHPFGCRYNGHDCGEVRVLDTADADGPVAVSVTAPAALWLP